jgi:predicted metalloprotease with PDZ domain
MVRVKEDVDAKRGTGDGPARIVAKAREMTGVDLQPQIDRHLVRGEPAVLPAAAFGECLTVATLDVAKYDRGFDVEGFGKPVTAVDPAGNAFAAGIRTGMIIVAREGGKVGDSTIENAYRIKDAAGERVIRYLPAGRERLAIQEVRVKPGSEKMDSSRCGAMLSGLRPGQR